MAKGKWTVEDKLEERTIKDLEGNPSGTIWIRYFTEADIEARQKKAMVKTSGKGRRARGGMDYDFRIENLRRYDLIEGLKSWDLEDEDGNPLPLPDGDDDASKNRRYQVLRGLPSKITQQIWRHITDLNELDTEEEAFTDGDKGKKAAPVSESPYDESSDSEDFSGNGESPYAVDSDEEGADVVPLDRS